PRFIFEGIGVAARRQKPLPEMLSADDAEMLRLDRLAQALHRRQQLGDAGAVHPLDAEELGQRLMRAAGLFEDFALNGATGESANLGNERPHGALALEIAIPGHMGGKITLQSVLVVPMRTGGIARPPFLPMRIGGGAVGELLATPDPAQT